MKKYILLLAFACLAFTSCSTEDTPVSGEPANAHSAMRGSYWDGVIGVDKGNGNYEITVNPATLMSDLESVMRTQGDTVTLSTIAIVKKMATNDNSEGYMLIAGDKVGTSIGLMLVKSSNSFKLDRGLSSGTENPDPDPATITCRGCATGCNLEYLNMPGGKAPYCKTNGCGDFCQTKYSSLF